MPETEIPQKISKRPEIQQRVDQEQKTNNTATSEARRIVARDLVIERQRGRNDRLQKEAVIDTLTGLPNFKGYTQKKEALVKLSKATGLRLAAASIDLDGLKEVNDKFGHRAGNELLKRTAKALMEATRESDLVARVGGDEFSLLLTDTDDVMPVVTRLRESLTKNGIRASIGIIPIGNDDDIEGKIHEADQMMYEEKRKRRLEKNNGNRIKAKLVSLVRRIGV